MANEAESASHTERCGDASKPAPGTSASRRDICTCFDRSRVTDRHRVRFHNDRQDTSSSAWQHLLALIEEAAEDGREVFRPLADLSPQERREIVTLPPTIAKLTAVK